jgi:ABC-type multidrug transport system fused ATPase/permease subunit
MSQKGRIAEQGTHASLKAQGGVYAHLLQTYKEGIIDA